MLEYRITKERRAHSTLMKAAPSEWASHIDAYVTLPGPLHRGEPEVEINWSCGARKWTTDDARKFFRAGLRLCAAADRELKARVCKAAREASDV